MADPKQEAYDQLAGEYEVRVLEPSPPAVTVAPFADDPTRDGDVPDGRLVVSPISGADLSWDEIAKDKPELADWCAERWLGAWRKLVPLPPGYTDSRLILHDLAENVLKAKRLPENEISLRYTRCGFGTPFFINEDGATYQMRVQHGHLVRQTDGEEIFEDIDGVDKDSGHALGEVFGFGCSVLEEVRAQNSDRDPSVIQLWPEHFDIAMEVGNEAAGARANVGMSPGDETHPEPYLYVGPWDAEKAKGDDELWNGDGFPGAELGYSEIVAADDQRGLALEFVRKRLDALSG